MQISVDTLEDLDPEAIAGCSEVQALISSSALASIVRRMEGMGFAIVQCDVAEVFEHDPASGSKFDCRFHRRLN